MNSVNDVIDTLVRSAGVVNFLASYFTKSDSAGDEMTEESKAGITTILRELEDVLEAAQKKLEACR